GFRWQEFHIASVRQDPSGTPMFEDKAKFRADAVVHVVDADEFARRLLAGWLAAAGVQTQTHAHLGFFLSSSTADAPGCLVIDAGARAIGGFELHAMLLPLTVPCPIVAMASKGEAPMAGRAMTAGAIEFVRKPLQEQEVMTAIHSALEVDRRRR